ncbi:putative calcium-binding protein CML49 [Zostera marina]|uniref:Putative calcium-binding protein CML49 n=1 Tax=Zostera marina TaxID=29655 RepID=A0A0K9NRA0_ZOSMR|nr:putative calcium-binding protein CML49 [Zostera marina]
MAWYQQSGGYPGGGSRPPYGIGNQQPRPPTYGGSHPPLSQNTSSAPPYSSSPSPSAPPYSPSPPGSYAQQPPPYSSYSVPYAAPSAPTVNPNYPYPRPSPSPLSTGGGSGYPYSGGEQGGGYGSSSPFGSLLPSSGFAPGTDPNIIACFQVADRDRSGSIDDNELQGALSSCNQGFSIRTVRLLMFLFTGNNTYRISPREFTSVFYSLKNWRENFERFDRDRSGKIDANELREALLSLGFSVTPAVLDLLILKFDKMGGMARAIEYDNFIECCLTVKGLTEKFREKDTMCSGTAAFSYESFMLSVLPFLIA